MMRIPEKVKVGPITYTVDEIEELNNGVHMGQHRNAEARLLLVKSLPDDVKLVTFWHEVIHALCEVSGQKQDERRTDALSHGLVQLFEANGWRIETE